MIGILAVLLAIVLVAINPARQFQQANDTKRQSDVNAILNAVHQYMAENAGNQPSGLVVGTDTAISEAGVGDDFCTQLVPSYIAALPADPTVNNGAQVDDCAAVGWDTGYTVNVSATDSRITVTAPSATGGTISVTR